MARRRIARFFMYFFLTVGAIIMIFPFFWMFASAFKPVSYTHLTLPTT